MPLDKPIEKEKDIDLCIELLLQGMPTKQISDVLTNVREYGKDRAYQIIAEAREAIKASSQFDRDEELGKAKRRLESLYFKFSKSKDHKNCLAVQKEITDLVGLRNVTVRNINVDAGKVPEEEKNRILRELNLLKEV